MKIVIIRSNPVRPDSRVEKEAYSLVKAGHQVTILCWDRDSNHEEYNEMIAVANLRIPIVRIGYEAGFGLGMKSLKPFLLFQIAMCNWLIKHRGQYDVIHACDFDMAFLSEIIAKIYRKKFVYDIFDFRFGAPENLVRRILYRAEISVINLADATIICTEDRKKQIADSKPKKLVVVHNSPFIEQKSSNLDVYKLNKQKIKVVYVGILQDSRLLLEIGEFFKKNHNIEWHIGGFGKYQDYFVELAQNNENIIFYDRLTYDKTLALEEACDIMLAIYDPQIENHIFAAPNKFYESLMLGKPLIMVKGTGMSTVVKDEDIGVLIKYSEEGFAKGVEEIVAKKGEWKMIEQRMKRLYKEKYSWEIMEKNLIELYAGL